MFTDYSLIVVLKEGRVYVQPSIVDPDDVGMSALDFVVTGDSLDDIPALLESARSEAERQAALPLAEQRFDADGTAPARAAGCRTERQFVKGVRAVDLAPIAEQGLWYVDRLEPDGGGLTSVEHHEVPLDVGLTDLVPLVLKLLHTQLGPGHRTADLRRHMP